MTFDELVSEVCERLNLTSDEAKSRVGREINSRYRRVTSSIGLDLSRRSEVSKVVTIGNRNVTFDNVEKILAVIDKSSGQDVPLIQISPDEMHVVPLRDDPPKRFAVMGIHPTSVDIRLDATPATAYTLYADAMVPVSTLAGNAQPQFPESFHDVLIFGAMSDEYRKMEKVQYQRDAEMDYEKRLSDLRMYIAVSGYKDVYQSKYQRSFRWSYTQYPWNS